MKKPTLREYLDGVREECNAVDIGGVDDPRLEEWTRDRATIEFLAHSRTNVEVLLNMVEAIYDEAVCPTRGFKDLEPGEVIDAPALQKQLEDLVPEGEE